MADTPSAQIWTGRALYFCAGLLIIFLELVPFNTIPRSWAPPDFLLALTAVWVARRPHYAPAPMIVFLFLLSDFLFQRPPGLWAAIVLVMTEALRLRAPKLREAPFAVEWATVAAAIVLATVLNRVILGIVMLPQAPLGLTLTQVVTTIALVPVLALAAGMLLGVSRPAPGEVNSYGHRL